MSPKQVKFSHSKFTLQDNENIVRNQSAPPPSSHEEQIAEETEVVAELRRYIQAKICADYNFELVSINDDEKQKNEEHTQFLASKNWQKAEKLLFFLTNSSGGIMGIFSRSFTIDKGISKGSMLPYIKRAKKDGYGVIVFQANHNTYTVNGTKKAIMGSETPDLHTLTVYEYVVQRAMKLKSIFLLSYGNGSSLGKDIVLKEMVASSMGDKNRIRGFVAIEASLLLEEDDAADVKNFLGPLALGMQCDSAGRGFRLAQREERLGCTAVSLGLPGGQDEVLNVAEAIELALEPAFDYLTLCDSKRNAIEAASASSSSLKDKGAVRSISFAAKSEPLGQKFHSEFCTKLGISPDSSLVGVPAREKGKEAAVQPASGTDKPKQTIFQWMFGKSAKKAVASDSDKDLTVKDFDLLKVVGKGAFGKVMLVRLKHGPHKGNFYAMKVLKKSVIAARDQIEHTKSERSILSDVKHPFLVQLRYAFQNDEKLYLLTDYYSGGSLYYHIKKVGRFDPARTLFYASSLFLGLEFLHNQNIIYRDLKLENILMHQSGYIAITDFGLSKQNVEENVGATTFCGTAEYIAPELLSGGAYGALVDWWAFGILIYEMLRGQTPFFDKNKRLMFYRIQNTEPLFPSGPFDVAATSLIKGLLNRTESERLGSKAMGGSKCIREHSYFSQMDFDKLLKNEIQPPFIPGLKSELDLKYIPTPYQNQKAEDSFDATVKKKKSKKEQAALHFEDFGFSEDDVNAAAKDFQKADLNA
jgi:serum/glucocorticoid-regulated kinase 2